MTPRTQRLVLLLVVILLIAYGTLFPLTGWRAPAGGVWRQFFTVADRVSFGDVLTNLFIFVPFGLLAAQLLAGRAVLPRLVLTVLLATTVSVSVELVQAYLPQRVSSFYDVALNALGACAGALIAINVAPRSGLGARLHSFHHRYFYDDPASVLGLTVAGLWIGLQLFPFVPSLDVGQLKQGLKPLVAVFRSAQPLAFSALVSYGLAVFAEAALLYGCMRRRPGRVRRIYYLVLGTLALKPLIVSRVLSPEALLGAVAGLAAFQLLRRRGRGIVTFTACSALFGVLAIAALRVDPHVIGTLYAFNWIPFRGHFSNSVIGMADLLESVWPYAAFAYFGIRFGGRFRGLVFAAGTLLLGTVAFALEWQQQFIPDRFADVTDVAIALAAWGLPWLLTPAGAQPIAGHDVTGEHHRPRSHRHRRGSSGHVARGGAGPGRRRTRRGFQFAIPTLCIIAVFGLGMWLATAEHTAPEQRVDESRPHVLPAPAELPAPKLPGFRSAHPRLPAPSAEDLARLEHTNPRYLEQQRERADGGAGDIHAALVSELAFPGSVSLEVLHARLLALEFSYRGHQQVKPLAVAYDWLHERWTPAQRATLRDKLIAGCEYVVEVIREQRLSPYNVYLYNSPFQALIACAIATWGDAPQADPLMRFAWDYWERRVLPVWRQVMGINGGWHEGGEYVGIGIGQAVYQVPAMWRAATELDYFATEPGLRGFLDFLVYRTQPDGSHFRWGDGAHHDRAVPDRVPLAIEYRHKAAYSLGGCPPEDRLGPTAWPWGPLPDPSLCDPDAAAKLPWSRQFDGIGLFVARQSWQPDATYVTFKAGDNFWSHSHLDQGAFTIFKRRPLALDSGIYGTKYGADHHMNYSYQTIAHNAVVVIDPADTVQAPTRSGEYRHIANDGGQRRIGSGWGVEAAPLDLDEWNARRHIYHTATILETAVAPDMLAVVADLTPAYTNELSGKGTFSHRTRRVRSYQRSFAYDRALDAVLVYDRVKIVDPTFRVKWLLHTETRPQTRGPRFDVGLERSMNRMAVGPAGLVGFVALPGEAILHPLGGPGMEFYVDGKNYDDNGEVQLLARKRGLTDYGEWRLEVEPAADTANAEFLVMLLPWVDAPPADALGTCAPSANAVHCTLQRDGKQHEYRISRLTGVIERAGP